MASSSSPPKAVRALRLDYDPRADPRDPAVIRGMLLVPPEYDDIVLRSHRTNGVCTVCRTTLTHDRDRRQEDVALKIVSKISTRLNAELVEREIRAWRALSHPRVLPLYGHCTLKDHVVLVSPWMKRGNLLEHIRANPDVDLALNYMHISYKTHWLRFPEIEPYLKSIGAVPTEKNPLTGADLYTVPAASFDGKVIVDSEAIAEHLERAFPDAPTLFPPGTRALQKAFVGFLMTQVLIPMGPVVGPGVPAIVDAESAEHVRALRRAPDGAPLDEWAPPGSEKHANAWKVCEEAWGKVAAAYSKADGPGVWLGGTEPIYSDFTVLAALIFISKVVTEDEWDAILGWHDGLWARLWNAGEPYMQAE